MTLAEKIQEMRKANNLTQEQLAEMLNVSRQAVSKWESEQSMPEIDKIVQMSEIFNTTTDCLLKNNPTKQQQAGRNDDAGNAKAALNTKQLSIISYAVNLLEKKNSICAVVQRADADVSGNGYYYSNSGICIFYRKSIWL